LLQTNYFPPFCSCEESECVNKPNHFLIKLTRIVHQGLQEFPTKILDILLVVKKILVPYVAICIVSLILSIKALVGYWSFPWVYCYKKVKALDVIGVFHGYVTIRKLGCLLYLCWCVLTDKVIMVVVRGSKIANKGGSPFPRFVLL